MSIYFMEPSYELGLQSLAFCVKVLVIDAYQVSFSSPHPFLVNPVEFGYRIMTVGVHG